MKRLLILTACIAACACQPKAKPAPDDSNYHERRENKPQGSCCETEKQAVGTSDKQVTLAPEVKAPEVKVETAK